MIELHVDNNSTYVYGCVDKVLKGQLRTRLGYRPENAIFKARNRKGWDGIETTLCSGRQWCKCAVKKDGMHFPTGLLWIAIDILEKGKFQYQLFDLRNSVDRVNGYSMSPEFEIRDYQQDAVNKSLEKGRGIITIATGGGKTGTSANLIVSLGVFPFVFFVPSKDLLKQTKDEFERFILKDGLPIKVGMVGDGKRELADITVMTVQTAVRALFPEKFVTKTKDGKTRKKKAKLFEDEDGGLGNEEELDGDMSQVKDYLLSAKGMIADEVQHWASETCQMISDSLVSCRYKFACSATPWRDKGDDILIDACFGRPICKISASYLIERNFLVQPTIFFVPVDNMKSASFDVYDDAYRYGIVENELRNQWAANMATKLQSQGRMVLMLVKNIDHGEYLEDLVPGSVFIHGSHSKNVREDHIASMKARACGVTIASTIFDEGIDVRPLDAVILCGGGKSQTRALQRVGRALRPYEFGGWQKNDAIIVDFLDQTKWLRQHSQVRRRIYETEPRFIVRDLKLG